MYRLDVEIKEISFDDHSLMSEEEFHCKQLLIMCNQFNELKQKDVLNYYKKRIEVMFENFDFNFFDSYE